MSSQIQTQITSILLIFLLIIAGFGIFTLSYSTLFLGLAALMAIIISAKGKKKLWVVIFAFIFVIFNPIYSFFNFSPSALKLFYILIAIIFGIFIYKYYDTYNKGDSFEKYVADRFPDGIWTIISRSKNYSQKLGRKVESDQNPDFIFRHNTSGNKIAVECKFRSYFYQGGIEINKNQIEKYKEYSQKENVPVFLAVGVGNSPQNPKRFFVIPLKDIEEIISLDSEIIPEIKIKKFEIDPKKEFIRLNLD